MVAKVIASLLRTIRFDESLISAAEIEPAFDIIRNLPEYKELEHLYQRLQ